MFRVIFIVMFSLTLVLAKQDPSDLQFIGVDVVHVHSDDSSEKVHIQRVEPDECTNVAMTPENLYDKETTHTNVNMKCIRSIVTTVGKIQPMQIAHGVKTVGEIEVLDFIENKSTKNPQKYVLIDSRKLNWYEHSTIPSAINLPYTDIEYDEDFPDDYENMLHLLSIKQVGDKLDFSNAKTALLFCNANWCGQSPTAIKILLKMGYPANKILWYRGGLQNWMMLGLNTIKPK